MSFWNKIMETLSNANAWRQPNKQRRWDDVRWAFVDIETGVDDGRIHDVGAVRWDGAELHCAGKASLMDFISDADFVCGHNIVHHDAKFLFGEEGTDRTLVDTLYMSPLLFPARPYHRLLKDDKIVSDEYNNPVNDCKKSYDLLMEEMTAWNALDYEQRQVYATLLYGQREFDGFLQLIDADTCGHGELMAHIRNCYRHRICDNADLDAIVSRHPVALAYALAIIGTNDQYSITPPWVTHNYPDVENIIDTLRQKRCKAGCGYCNAFLDHHAGLKRYFGYDRFRTYEGKPLQEQAVKAAVEGESLLAIFPTGGGKSLTFQLPALMENRNTHGLTVVISPLQSLMKDQVDSLAAKGIIGATTINGLLDPISRSHNLEMVASGYASLLYISPETLRSKTMERILTVRHVVRFVIDEAHCFSSWGQDFRVDYLYIGKFISEYQKSKGLKKPVPVSCFTATAKQKVIHDIRNYFKETLGLELRLFASSASRMNLSYAVMHADSEEDKYQKLRSLIGESECPVIVYVARTKRTLLLAKKLTRDGHSALPFNGRMTSEDKTENQDAFMNDKVRVIVATSAFGMGVDKSNVGLVVHYDISDSLENYVQEAGRAGRDPMLSARCIVLYCDNDLDKHFLLLNQTKLNISEIQQVWKAVKDMTRQRRNVSCSALEIARKAGWDDHTSEMETRVKTALSALEQSGYIERGQNMPHVYATGITVKNLEEARAKITRSTLFGKDDISKSVRIFKSLISKKYIAKAQDSDAESRVDYLADILGMTKREVVTMVQLMRQTGILADSMDISAYINDAGDSAGRSRRRINMFAKLERFLLNNIPDDALRTSYKHFNDKAQHEGIPMATEKNLRTLIYFLVVNKYVKKHEDSANNMELTRTMDMQQTVRRYEKRHEICLYVIDWLNRKATYSEGKAKERRKT